MQLPGKWRKILSDAAFWVFFILFMLAAYANDRTGKQLDQVCRLIPLPAVIHLHPKSDQERAEAICAERLKPSGKTYAD